MTAIPPNMDSAIRERTGEIGDFVGVGVGVAAVVTAGRVVSVRPEVFIVVMVFVGEASVTWNVTIPTNPFESVKSTV